MSATASNCLRVTVEATQEALRQRVREATTRRRTTSPREVRARTDAYLVAASRHVAAMEQVLLPELRSLGPDGLRLAKGYVAAARRLEKALACLEAALGGEVHAVRLPWSDVWDRVRRAQEEHDVVERDVVERIGEARHAQRCAELATRLFRAEVRAPTRPHPYLPHSGMAALVTRRAWAAADRFWDLAQNRAVPPPVRPRTRSDVHASLVSQYVLAEPRFDGAAPVVTRRRTRRTP